MSGKKSNFVNCKNGALPLVHYYIYSQLKRMRGYNNYDKRPATHVDGTVAVGWKAIVDVLCREWGDRHVWAIDLYVGSYSNDFIEALATTGRRIIDVRQLMLPERVIRTMTHRFVTDDVLFGYMSNLRMEDFFDAGISSASDGDDCIVVGTGAALVAGDDAPVAYADLARWELQQRFRRHDVTALGVDNSSEPPAAQYKRGYFNDWRVCDEYKDRLFEAGRIDYWIDANDRSMPKMITDSQLREGLRATAARPFRVVPFFDPAPWGGQWMKEVCGLDSDVINYGWCFDCVPEENSLLLSIDGNEIELPSQDLVLWQPKALLGERVWARFGRSFPIRFDFLDTMGGGNLSLQVHPTTDFANREFGLAYTQDESYYLLDAEDDAVVFLGLKEGIDKQQMISDLQSAEKGETVFDAEKYVNKWHAHKHDHYLIPAGTIHCSGRNSMVLEISSTPNIFTFKLWDWNRLGLDGKPRPINVERGRKVIQWHRTTQMVSDELCNHFETLSSDDGITEERTGLHRLEFIETRRHTFTRTVEHDTQGGVNVINVCEGEEVVVESPEGHFAPFTVHYAETFIVPAAVGRYTITPSGKSEGKKCMTIKASIR